MPALGHMRDWISVDIYLVDINPDHLVSYATLGAFTALSTHEISFERLCWEKSTFLPCPLVVPVSVCMLAIDCASTRNGLTGASFHMSQTQKSKDPLTFDPSTKAPSPVLVLVSSSDRPNGIKL